MLVTVPMRAENGRIDAMTEPLCRSSEFDPDERAEQLLSRAREMIPVLRARERAAIETGQVSSQTIDEFTRAGFFRVLQPRRYGGYELPPKVYFTLARTLAEGCMSSAWVYAVLAVHNWQLALFEDR